MSMKPCKNCGKPIYDSGGLKGRYGTYCSEKCKKSGENFAKFLHTGSTTKKKSK